MFPVGGCVADDRLSRLPDDIIRKVLSFIRIKDAIKTSVLSSRWRYLWTSMPHLDFSYLPSKFITDVLSHPNKLSGLSSIILRLGRVESVVLERFLNYAFSNNLQQLTLECYQSQWDNFITFPVSLFSSKSLTHLTLGPFVSIRFNTPESTWELLALTTLHLNQVTFYNDNKDKCIDLFSKCVNLKNLTLKQCKMRGSKGCFSICRTYLSILTIIDYRGELFERLQFCSDSLHSLEKLDLCLLKPEKVYASTMFGLFQHLHGVKFLMLNLDLVEFLSSSMEQRISRPSPFVSLKSLMIYPASTRLSPLSAEIKNYFLDSSPSACLTFISHQEAMSQWAYWAFRPLKSK